MASFDRQFEVVRPSLDKLTRANLEVADTRILDPQSTSPLALIDGEFMQEDGNYKMIRTIDGGGSVDRPSYATIEWRGDYGVQASRKLAILRVGGYEADTLVFNSGLTTLGAAVQVGSVTLGGGARSGLVASAGGFIIGYITRVAASNGGRLRFLQTGV